MEILSTTIKIRKENSETISISKELPPVTFYNILNNHLQKIT
jgi:hypothetical protein